MRRVNREARRQRMMFMRSGSRRTEAFDDRPDPARLLVLANVDYRTHMTDEGDQLQLGLESAGWRLAGAGYGDGLRHVPRLLDRHQPEVVFVQDKRDWDPASGICFRSDVAFQESGALARHAAVKRLAVVKDAGSSIEYHRQFCEEIAAHAVLIYYHERSVLAVSPWLRAYPLVRAYHTVDAVLLEHIDITTARRRALVSGAVSPQVYPLRKQAFEHARKFGIDVMRHPGYNNRRSSTPSYLRALATYRVHVATASVYGFALRKIIESVAVGATPVTNLPSYDVLPQIDAALVRIPPHASLSEVRDAVDHADRTWNLEERREYARRARVWYDWRAMGIRNSEAMQAAVRPREVVVDLV